VLATAASASATTPGHNGRIAFKGTSTRTGQPERSSRFGLTGIAGVLNQVDLSAADVEVTGWFCATGTTDQLDAVRRVPDVDFRDAGDHGRTGVLASTHGQTSSSMSSALTATRGIPLPRCAPPKRHHRLIRLQDKGSAHP
jgi:hypothetical protein